MFPSSSFLIRANPCSRGPFGTQAREVQGRQYYRDNIRYLFEALRFIGASWVPSRNLVKAQNCYRQIRVCDGTRRRSI